MRTCLRLAALYLVVVAILPAVAALQTFDQRDAELRAVLDQGRAAMGVGLPIDRVEFVGPDLYRLTAGDCRVDMQIHDLPTPRGYSGPRRFEARPTVRICAPTSILWFWGPLGLAMATALFYGLGAYAYRRRNYPAKVNAAGFAGTVRATAKFELVGSGAGLFVSLLSSDLAQYLYVRYALGAVLIISLVATVLNYYMAAALDTRTLDEGKSIELTSPIWEVIHGVVFGLSLAAAISILATAVAFVVRL